MMSLYLSITLCQYVPNAISPNVLSHVSYKYNCQTCLDLLEMKIFDVLLQLSFNRKRSFF